MTLQEISLASGILSSIGVVGSLIFVGFQLRQNTRAMRAQIHQNITAGWLGVGPMVAGHARAFAAGIASNERSFADLPDEDKLTYMSAIFVFFKHYENMYLQYKEGFIRKQDWEAWTSHMFLYWRMSGVQLWWKRRRDAFSPEFRDFIESSPQPSMPSQTELFTQITRGAPTSPD